MWTPGTSQPEQELCKLQVLAQNARGRATSATSCCLVPQLRCAVGSLLQTACNEQVSLRGGSVKRKHGVLSHVQEGVDNLTLT